MQATLSAQHLVLGHGRSDPRNPVSIRSAWARLCSGGGGGVVYPQAALFTKELFTWPPEIRFGKEGPDHAPPCGGRLRGRRRLVTSLPRRRRRCGWDVVAFTTTSVVYSLPLDPIAPFIVAPTPFFISPNISSSGHNRANHTLESRGHRKYFRVFRPKKFDNNVRRIAPDVCPYRPPYCCPHPSAHHAKLPDHNIR